MLIKSISASISKKPEALSKINHCKQGSGANSPLMEVERRLHCRLFCKAQSCISIN